MKTYMTLSVVGFVVTATVRITFAVTTYTTGSSSEKDGCPASSTWTNSKQSCYLYLDDNANSTQAIDSCERLGAKLVSIGSEEENQFILDFVGKMPIWIGLIRTTTDICAGNTCGSWEWLDGSKLEYSHWATDIVPNSLQCVFMGSDGEWDHGRLCSGQRGLVCEQKRIFPSTTPDGCPASSTWTPNKQSCYLYLDDNANSTQAIDRCRGLGAQLVSIGSEEENQFILELVGAMNLPIWIGLLRTMTDICAGNSCGGWEWSDGRKLGYSHWAPGIVANSLPCVFMDSQGQWDHGRLCSAQRGLICEQTRIFPSTTSELTTQTSISNFPNSSSGDVDPTADSTTTDSDQSSTYTIIGVIVGTVVVAAVLGSVAYFIKTRRRKEREMHESDATSQTRGVSTGSGVYENDCSGAFRRPTEGHDLDRDNSVHINPFTRTDADTIMYNDAPRDHSAYEAHQAYERVNNYLQMDPEYTQLTSIQSCDTSETIPEGINVVYTNFEQK